MDGRPQNTGSSKSSHCPPRYHVHSSYIWLGSLRAIIVFIFVLAISCASSIASLVESVGGHMDELGEYGVSLGVIIAIVLFALLVIIGLAFGIHAWSWKHLYYELGPEEFSLYSGIIVKKRVHVPYQRVQSVDQRASLLQRIFGVCNVSIDTAGGSSNKAILIPYLTKSVADSLRGELFARKQIAAGSAPTPVSGIADAEGNVLDVGEKLWNDVGGVFAGEEVQLEPASFEYSLSNKELIFTGLSNSSGFFAALLVVLSVILQIVGAVAGIFPTFGEMTEEMLASPDEMYASPLLIGIGLAVIIGVAVVIWVISLIGSCLQYGGFHARRRGGRIEVERGLLQHQSQSVSIDRVQAVVIKQSFIRRIIGYCEISLAKIDAKDATEENNNSSALSDDGVVIHPFLKIDRVNEVLNGLIPEYGDMPTQERKLAKVSLRRGLIRRCIWQGLGFWMIVIGAIALVALYYLQTEVPSFADDPDDYIALFIMGLACYAIMAIGVLVAIINIIGTVMWARNSAFAINSRFMKITNGGFSKESVMFMRSKIQYGFTRQNPLQRLAKTATIDARTAAGVGGTDFSLIDVKIDDGLAFLEWLKPRARV